MNSIAAAERSRAEPTVGTSASQCSAEPSEIQVLLLALFTFIVFLAVILRSTNYGALVDNFGDSSAYMSIAAALRRWDFHGVVVKQFWGLPYAMAAMSLLTGISDCASLLLISVLSSLVSVVLAHRLWGGWVAACFAVLNFDWLQRTLLGGSEPLFMALLLASFLAARRQQWFFSSALASLATVVRPLGLFALVGIGALLLRRRKFREFATAVAIGLAIGVTYAVPLAIKFGDPFATVHSYDRAGQTGPHLFGFPFYAIIKGTILYGAPWTNLILTFGWILFVLGGTVAMTRKQFREYAEAQPVEVIFAAAYLLSICCYNFPYWARGTFPRFAIPIVPFVLAALERWWPKDRRILWVLATISPVLAAASALGVKQFL